MYRIPTSEQGPRGLQNDALATPPDPHILHSGQNPSSPTIAHASKLLSRIHPKKTHLAGTAAYELARSAFWSQLESKTSPACIFQPESPADVSSALIILRQTACPFGVKSGGHGQATGESAIEGVLIDLAKLTHIEVTQDRSSVLIGPGHRWHSVFQALEPLGLTIIGGRAGTVGVGGFLLGGGISWYSNLYGWGCDSIRSYEVVLANGTIAIASKDSHPELYRCLRGGAGNFGIVTSMELETLPYTGMWAGEKMYKLEHSEKLAKTFIDIGVVSDYEDRKAFFIYWLTTTDKKFICGTSLNYCDGVDNPPVFDPLAQIPSMMDTCGLQNQSDLVAKLGTTYPSWMQNALASFAIKVDLNTIRICDQIWMEEMQPLVDEVAGFKAQFVYQYITAGTIEAASRNGGNVTGLAGTEPYIMINPEPSWSYARDNARVYAAIDRSLQRMTAESRRLGTDHDYLYINYATVVQEPIKSYGKEANDFMRRVAGKYDPEGVFQKLRTAGFKFSGAPQRHPRL